MNQQIMSFLLWLLPVFGTAQQLADLRAASVPPGRTVAETAVSIGQHLIGRPYVAHALEDDAHETLVVNLRRFDCQTFVESVLALALAEHEPNTVNNPDKLDAAFRQHLTRLRYRNGQIDGYASRLHYLSDWFRNNEQKGILRDVTQEIGGVQVSKSMSYMTQSPAHYPRLADQVVLQQVAQVEASLSRQAFWFIPKKDLRLIENQLRDGDVVMLTAGRPGLDARHVGFIVRQAGRAHLLHASSDRGQVVLTGQPITDYVQSHPRMSGIRVARLRLN